MESNVYIVVLVMIAAVIQMLVSIVSAINKNSNIVITLYLRKTGMTYIMVSG